MLKRNHDAHRRKGPVVTPTTGPKRQDGHLRTMGGGRLSRYDGWILRQLYLTHPVVYEDDIERHALGVRPPVDVEICLAVG